jgi:hypothetical protein
MVDDMKPFTIRIPKELYDQIKTRSKIHHRKLNGEINVLLATAMDASVNSDLQVLKKSEDQSQIE